jgi:beta-glucosidase
MDPLSKGMSSQQIDEWVDKVLPLLTLYEKVYILSGNTSWLGIGLDVFLLKHYNRKPYSAGGIRHLGIPALKFCDGPRGVVSGSSTCFPVSMARGASWDPAIEERIGEAIGREVRAHGGNYFGGVCINLLRHPAWGRAQETYGEDPYLIGEMGAALTRGVQRHNVMACVKHYAANSMENTRFRVNVTMDERTLHEVYLPHFKRCIDEGAASVMGAYNRVNGDQCCESDHLLNQILFKEWGFDGFTLSDFGYGVRDAVKAINSGMDIEMPIQNKYNTLPGAVKQGKVSLQTIDRAVRRVLRTLARFTTAPDPQDYPPELIACSDHRAIAQEVAEKSIVLLKNEGAILPLDPHKVKRLAVIGKLASQDNLGDHGSSHVFPPQRVTILDGLHSYATGQMIVEYADGSDPQAASTIASHADAVVIVAGCRAEDEGEYISEGGSVGGDRVDLALRKDEVALIQMVAEANPVTVMVLIGGSAITMEEWRTRVKAILMAFYPGMQGGTALSRILFGEVNPSGKLPFTIPTQTGHLPPFDRDATEVTYDLYHGYTLLEKNGHQPAFAFGYGLSYTTFEYTNLHVRSNADGILASIDLHNTGSRDGEEVVQLYIGFEHSSHDRQKKILRGFCKVGLRPGQKDTIHFALPRKELTWYNPETHAWEVETMTYTVYVGGSSRHEDLLSKDVPVT